MSIVRGVQDVVSEIRGELSVESVVRGVHIIEYLQCHEERTFYLIFNMFSVLLWLP